jgi:hypothetical protein
MFGWEAKTLGAKRRISSSEIATVPGTLDLVELLFSAVLMLVDFVSWFCEPQQSDPRKKAWKAQEPRGTRRVED